MRPLRTRRAELAGSSGTSFTNSERRRAELPLRTRPRDGVVSAPRRGESFSWSASVVTKPRTSHAEHSAPQAPDTHCVAWAESRIHGGQAEAPFDERRRGLRPQGDRCRMSWHSRAMLGRARPGSDRTNQPPPTEHCAQSDAHRVKPGLPSYDRQPADGSDARGRRRTVRGGEQPPRRRRSRATRRRVLGCHQHATRAGCQLQRRTNLLAEKIQECGARRQRGHHRHAAQVRQRQPV
jgi:hypothetical protein